MTFVQVKRLLAAPAALATPSPAAPVPAPAAASGRGARRPQPGAPARAGQPDAAGTTAADVTALLDEAFGAEPG